MISVLNFASFQLFVTNIRVECICHPPRFVSSHMFAATLARLRRRSELKLIENRNRLPCWTIHPGRKTSTGATCHSCPISARACSRADARMPMHARQCTHPHDCEPAHLLPHRCSTRDSPRTTNTVFSRTHSHSLLPIPTRATCCLTPHLLAIPRPDRSLPLAHTLGPPTFFLARTT